MQNGEIQQSRCQFPGCTCTCMHRHNTQDICVRCMHHSAWHEQEPRQRTVRPLAQADLSSTSDESETEEHNNTDTRISNHTLVNNLMQLLELDPNERTNCCVCMQEACDVVLKPCGHARFCRKCMEHQTVTTCPICRIPIENKISFIPL